MNVHVRPNEIDLVLNAMHPDAKIILGEKSNYHL